MKTLALELSAARGSVAWLNDDHVLRVCEFANDRRHSGLFFENLRAILREFGAPDSIAVGIGPGSYAGVRIAVAAAHGLRVANCARLVGVPSICAFETDAPEYIAIGDARRQTFYFARVAGNRICDGPELLNELELKNRLEQIEQVPIFTSERLPQFPNAATRFPSAALIGKIALASPTNLPTTLEPIYLRAPHITVAKE